MTRENIFNVGTGVLNDNKHLKNRHVGLFAVNLKTACNPRLIETITPRSQPSLLNSTHTCLHTSLAVKNNQSTRPLYIPEIDQQPPRSNLPERFTSCSTAVENGRVNTRRHHTNALQPQLLNPSAHHRIQQLSTMAENPEINPSLPVQNNSGAPKPLELKSLLNLCRC